MTTQITLCVRASDSARPKVWYADRPTRELGTLGGDHSWINDLNSQGEAVGVARGGVQFAGRCGDLDRTESVTGRALEKQGRG